MRALLGGDTVLDSQRGVVMWETGMFPAYYYPLDDLRQDLLEEPRAGEREATPRRWSVRVAWSLPHPTPEWLSAAGHVCFYPDKLDIEVDGSLISQ